MTSTKNIISRLLICFFTLSTGVAQAQVCAAPVVDQSTYGLTGIGDGCTLSYDSGGVTFNAAWIPNIYFFKGTFTGSCNRHDKCLTQIGNTTSECNSEFYSNMRDACHSKYKWYQPVERMVCNDTAFQYYSAVQAFQSDALTNSLQRASVDASYRVGAEINNNNCASTPERLALYSNSFITEVNNAFLLRLGRYPTIYEFMSAANSTSYVDNQDQWRTYLSGWISYFASLPEPPPAAFTADTSYGLTLTANTIADASYIFKVNGATSYSQDVVAYPEQPMYDTRISVNGFLQVSRYGVRNAAIIEGAYFLSGGCASSPGMSCY